MLHWDAQWTEELTMLRVAIQHVNRLRPKFLLISGDLINAFPSSDPDNTAAAREVCLPMTHTTHTHPPPSSDRRSRLRPSAPSAWTHALCTHSWLCVDAAMTPRCAWHSACAVQVVSFKDALHELDTDIPLVLQPGNHDIGQHATIETIRTYAERFGDDYFSFWAGGVLYVSLNSQFYRSDKGDALRAPSPMRATADASRPCVCLLSMCMLAAAHDGTPLSVAGIEHLRKAQDEWAIETFRTAKTLGAKHVVGLSHVPPFVGDESEVGIHPICTTAAPPSARLRRSLSLSLSHPPCPPSLPPLPCPLHVQVFGGPDLT
jgi:3',5'-cyclic AMP phosphodiesterase CpdA